MPPLSALASALRALLGPKVPAATREHRQLRCRSCPLLQKAGPLHTCGVPWWKKPERDDVSEGCGCVLDAKWRARGQGCPRGLWEK